ncbi:MAG: hypothetical protein KAF91_23260 [Nostoc sp. TH1S01]|nr:hypothetical protein [Nostoc sp. TH1S01]
MQKKFSRLTAIVIFGLVNIITLPIDVKAQDSNVKCRKAVANAKNRLQEIPNILIKEVYTKEISDSDAPIGRPTEYIFYLTPPIRNGRKVETGINSLANSPQLMRNLSQDIINKCSSVSLVSFGTTEAPGCGISFGLMHDGTVKQFDYVDPSDARPLKWGETTCT